MRRWTGHAAIAAVVLAFTVASGYSALRLTQQFSTIIEYLRTSNWMAAQANFEYLRLTQAVTVFQLEPTPQARQAMMTRLELFWSRLPLILEGEEGRYTRFLPGVAERIAVVLNDLPILERRLAGLDGKDMAAFHTALAQLEVYRPTFQSLMQALLTETASSAEDAVQRRYYESLVAFSIVVLAGTCLIVLLTRSLRRARAAQAEASQARQQLEDAIESINEGFVCYDKDERLVIANSQYKEFYPAIADLVRPGIRLEDLLRASAERGQYDTGLTPEEWTRVRLEQYRRSSWPVRQVLADGRILRINDRRTRDGGIVSVRADVSELVQAGQLLKKRLAAIEAAPDGIAIVAPDGRMQYANESFCALFGRSVAAIPAFDWTGLFAADERAKLRQRLAGAESGARRWRERSVGVRDDGSRFPVNTGFAKLDDGGLVLVVRDVTPERQAEQKRAELERQLNQAQKMEAIGRLAGGIAHDFNNSLTAISGYAGFLVEDLPAGSPQIGFAENVAAAARRAKELVQQILAFSRLQEVERQPVDPATVVDSTVRMLRAMLPPATELSVTADGAGAPVLANATLLGQVLMNLCLNAHDALDGRNGSIRIALDGPVAPPRGPAAQMVAAAAGAPGTFRLVTGTPQPDACYVRITVNDDGGGMAPDIMERIFDPFFTTKAVGKGTGLGLAAAHGITMAHQGLIEVASRVGGGTQFHLYLPAMDGGLQPAPALPAPEALPVPPGKGRVLVVDDQESVATMTATMLERMGYEPTVCISSEEALEALTEDASAWDIVLTDYLMPGPNGLDLARHVARLRRALPVVLSTGYTAGLTEGQARAAGVVALLHKPVGKAALAAALRAALDQADAAEAVATRAR